MIKLTPTEYKLLKVARKDLMIFSSSWCEHWLYGRINIYDRINKLPATDILSFYKALESLIKKKLIKIEHLDNYTWNVEATKLIR
jgi:hypothetical protein